MIKKYKIKNEKIILLFLFILYVNLKTKEKETLKYKKDFKRIKKLYAIVNKWLSIEICGGKIEKAIIEHGYKNVAIYGMGDLGQRLLEKLEIGKDIKVLYGIDQNAENISTIVPVYPLKKVSHLKMPDLLILTTYCSDDSLINLLRKKFSCPVWSIEELLNEIK